MITIISQHYKFNRFLYHNVDIFLDVVFFITLLLSNDFGLITLYVVILMFIAILEYIYRKMQIIDQALLTEYNLDRYNNSFICPNIKLTI